MNKTCWLESVFVFGWTLCVCGFLCVSIRFISRRKVWVGLNLKVEKFQPIDVGEKLTSNRAAPIRWWKVERFTAHMRLTSLRHKNRFWGFIRWWWSISCHWSEFFSISVCWHCTAKSNIPNKFNENFKVAFEVGHIFEALTYLIIVVCIFCAINGSSVSI